MGNLHIFVSCALDYLFEFTPIFSSTLFHHLDSSLGVVCVDFIGFDVIHLDCRSAATRTDHLEQCFGNDLELSGFDWFPLL